MPVHDGHPDAGKTGRKESAEDVEKIVDGLSLQCLYWWVGRKSVDNALVVIMPNAAALIERSTMATVSTPDFAAFRNGFGGSVCKRLGVDISDVTGWRDYTETMVDFNAREGHLVDAARRFAGVASSGEVLALYAVLAAADFCWLADELCGRNFWDSMSTMGDSVRETVAAVILRRD